MYTIQILLPEAVREMIDRRMAEDGYRDLSEYFSELVRRDERRLAEEQLDSLIREGFESGAPVEMDEAFWERKHAEIEGRVPRENAGR
jgi:antitoxin ParD1/3/4